MSTYGPSSTLVGACSILTTTLLPDEAQTRNGNH